jgi:SAM-dependent methyltransferase
VVAEAERVAAVCPLGCAALEPDPTPLRDNRFALPHEVRVAWCPECGLGVTLDAPGREELAELYEQEYPDDGRVPRTGALARVWHAVNGSLPIADRVREGPVLDVGCHTGETLAALQARGFAVVGLEPNPRAAAVARARGLDVVGEPIEQADLPRGRFRTVLLSQVLEHVEDPHLVLGKVSESLAPGGAASIVVPNAESAARRLFGAHWAHWHVPFHLFHHTVRSLRKLCVQSGLEIRRLETVTPGEYLMLSILAWRNARRGRYSIEPFTGRYGTRVLLAPLGRALDLAGRGDAIYAEAVPSS